MRDQASKSRLETEAHAIVAIKSDPRVKARNESKAAAAVEKTMRDTIEWLTGDQCHDLDNANFVAGLGERLQSLGLPLDRLALHLRTLNPEFLGRTFGWSLGEAVGIFDRSYGAEPNENVMRQPTPSALGAREWVIARIDDDRTADWMRLGAFRDRGLVELVVAPLLNGPGPASAVAFGTRRHAGFSDQERKLFQRLVPVLRTVSECRALHQMEVTVLDTYLGTATGQRILAGHVRRGEVETIEAALLLCDMRGFTELSNRLPESRVLELLNQYFDEIVPAITEAEGEIFKFMGDAVIAFFRYSGGAPASCAAALNAAQVASARVAAMIEPDAKIAAGIALHYGAVSYGNIGSGHRLDFTMIGSDVNLVSRIQGVCAQTGHPILMSERFLKYLNRHRRNSAGRHALKGFSKPVELFVPEVP